MKISIKGAYGDSNFGDDLLMIVFEDFMNNTIKNIELNFVGIDSKYVSKFLTHSTYNNQNICDLLIYGGGTQFFSFIEKSTLSSKFKNNVFNNPLKTFRKILDRISKENDSTAKAFLGFGLGPFTGNVKYINLVKNQLKNSLFIGVRDEVSHQYCNEWDIKAFLGADVVFSSYFNNYIRDVPKIIVDTNKIGIIVRDWEWKNSQADYSDQIINFVNANPQLDITFIIFAKDRDTKWLNKIKDYKSLVWDPENMTINFFLEALNAFSTFITARYHGAIIAGLLGKKVVCVEIEPKLKILVQQIPSFVLWKDDFKLESLTQILQSDLETDHKEHIENLRHRADNMLEHFVEIYNIKFKNA